ncbi:hypothetical protein Tco_0271618 [Tanacetum coccineum]
MQAIYGPNIDSHSVHLASNWCSILREMQTLKDKGFDFLSLCSKRVGDDKNSRFWLDIWKGDITLRELGTDVSSFKVWWWFGVRFGVVFGYWVRENCTVAAKMASLVDSSFRRPVRGGNQNMSSSTSFDHILIRLPSLIPMIDGYAICLEMASLE